MAKQNRENEMVVESNSKKDEDSFEYDGTSLKLGTIANTTDDEVGDKFGVEEENLSPIGRPFMLNIPSIIVKERSDPDDVQETPTTLAHHQQNFAALRMISPQNLEISRLSGSNNL